MNNPVSGESSASGQGPHIAVGPAAVAIRRPELWNAWNMARPSGAGRGVAGLGEARNMAWHGRAWRAGLGLAWNMARLGPAWRGWAWLGEAWNMAWHGQARPGGAGPERGKELGLA